MRLCLLPVVSADIRMSGASTCPGSCSLQLDDAIETDFENDMAADWPTVGQLSGAMYDL